MFLSEGNVVQAIFKKTVGRGFTSSYRCRGYSEGI